MTTAWLAALDLMGTFVFGLSGAMLAVRRRLDVVGVLALAVAAALAGGMIRDGLLGRTPVTALADDRYLVVALLAGLVGFVAHPWIERVGKPVLVLDAVGLGVFAVTGCRVALDAGLDPLAAMLLGVLSAVGGGAVRDLMVAEVPRVLREEVYALAALVGTGVVAVAPGLGLAGPAALLAGAALATGLRLLSVRRGWQAPRAPWT